ncbi:MAG: PadR family transcriptional regulator [Lawsonella sp.]
MISSDFIRGYIDLIVLSILKNEPNYGYGISKAIEDITQGDYTVKQTTLYSAFKRLEKNNYVTPFSQIGPTGKERTYYRITPAGADYYHAKCQEWDDTKRIVNLFITPRHSGTAQCS